ncbi:MAG: FAD binding domain-containing protein [Syntrophorhabdaceae bacterium]|nr:FAD binding domain-containing protein [Syntrophorhabdaceae bacterium]
MRLPPFEIFEPKTKGGGFNLLNRYKGDIKVISGGTELVVLMKDGLLRPRYLMSLKNIKGLKGIRRKGRSLIIGCATPLEEIIKSREVKSLFPALVDACILVAAPPIQNRATIGGNILQDTRCIYYNQTEIFRNGLEPCLKGGGNLCRAIKGGKRCFSVYQSDIAPVLIAYDAKVKIESKGESKSMPIMELFTDKGEKPFTLEGDELLTEIEIPIPGNGGKGIVTYKKFRVRDGIEYPFASAAAMVSINGGGQENVVLVIGACGASPKRLSFSFSEGDTIEAKMGEILDGVDKKTVAIDNLALPGEYRKEMFKIMAKRAIKDAYDLIRKEKTL